jgi:hypothetical protein
MTTYASSLTLTGTGSTKLGKKIPGSVFCPIINGGGITPGAATPRLDKLASRPSGCEKLERLQVEI